MRTSFSMITMMIRLTFSQRGTKEDGYHVFYLPIFFSAVLTIQNEGAMGRKEEGAAYHGKTRPKATFLIPLKVLSYC